MTTGEIIAAIVLGILSLAFFVGIPFYVVTRKYWYFIKKVKDMNTFEKCKKKFYGCI